MMMAVTPRLLPTKSSMSIFQSAIVLKLIHISILPNYTLSYLCTLYSIFLKVRTNISYKDIVPRFLIIQRSSKQLGQPSTKDGNVGNITPCTPKNLPYTVAHQSDFFNLLWLPVGSLKTSDSCESS